MQNIQVGSQERVYLEVYSDGVLTQADSLPTLTIYDADNDASPIAGLDSVTVVDEPEAGKYSFLLTQVATNSVKVLELKWSYVLNGLEIVQTDFYKVETPYSQVNEIIDFLNFGVSPSDINYHSVSEIETAEKIARTIIDGYTGIKFYLRNDSQEIFGVGSDAIQLIERMTSIDKMYENGVLVVDNTVTPAYNQFGYGIELTQTGYVARLLNPGWDVRYDDQVDTNILYYGKFRDGARYKFVGDIGYKYVPEDIKQASMLLVNDLLSNDYAWRNKYLSKVNLSEISFEMSKGAFNGTGNVTVDNILDQYRNINMMII